jgi:hypothetical protein
VYGSCLYLEERKLLLKKWEFFSALYFTGFAMIFDRSKPAAFQPYPPNFIFGENSFCLLKFPISDFSNLGDSHSPFGGIWG